MNEIRSILSETLPFWEKISVQEQNSLCESAIRKHFNPGDILHQQGDCSGLFVVESGRVRAYIISETGKEITLYRLLERDICLFSASCMIRDLNFTVIVEAETKVEAILLPVLVYKSLMNRSLPITEYTNALMASRFSDVMWVMEQVLFTSFDRRLANFLLEQSAIEQSDTVHLTHEQIAQHLGSAREVVTRMLKYFQSEKMVKLSRGEIMLIDRQKLSML